MDTYEFTFPGGSAIITTTTGGTKEAPDFSVSDRQGRTHAQIFAAEILRLTARDQEHEKVAREALAVIFGELDDKILDPVAVLAKQAPIQRALAAELLRAKGREEEHERLMGELTGALGISLESDTEVGPAVLGAVQQLSTRASDLSRVLQEEAAARRSDAQTHEEEMEKLAERVRELEEQQLADRAFALEEVRALRGRVAALEDENGKLAIRHELTGRERRRLADLVNAFTEMGFRWPHGLKAVLQQHDNAFRTKNARLTELAGRVAELSEERDSLANKLHGARVANELLAEENKKLAAKLGRAESANADLLAGKFPEVAERFQAQAEENQRLAIWKASITSACHALLAEFLPAGSWSESGQLPGNLDHHLWTLQLAVRYRLERLDRERQHHFEEEVRLRSELAERASPEMVAHLRTELADYQMLYAGEQRRAAELEADVQRQREAKNKFIEVAGKQFEELVNLRADYAAAIRTGEEQAEKIEELRSANEHAQRLIHWHREDQKSHRANFDALARSVGASTRRYEAAEDRLSRLDALLSSEVVPPGLNEAFEPMIQTHEGSTAARRAWRWFREALGEPVLRAEMPATAEPGGEVRVEPAWVDPPAAVTIGEVPYPPVVGNIAQTPLPDDLREPDMIDATRYAFGAGKPWRPLWEKEAELISETLTGAIETNEFLKKLASRVDAAEADAELGRALAAILSKHCGGRGDSEGWVPTLERIIRERDDGIKADRLDIRATHSENAALLEILREVEFEGEGDTCPLCGFSNPKYRPESPGHISDCRLGLALAGKAPVGPSGGSGYDPAAAWMERALKAEAGQAKILAYTEAYASLASPVLAWQLRAIKADIEAGKRLGDSVTVHGAPYEVVEEQRRADAAARRALEEIVERKRVRGPEKPLASGEHDPSQQPGD